MISIRSSLVGALLAACAGFFGGRVLSAGASTPPALESQLARSRSNESAWAAGAAERRRHTEEHLSKYIDLALHLMEPRSAGFPSAQTLL